MLAGIDRDRDAPFADGEPRTVAHDDELRNAARLGNLHREPHELGLEHLGVAPRVGLPVGATDLAREHFGLAKRTPRARGLAVLLVAAREIEERARLRVGLVAREELGARGREIAGLGVGEGAVEELLRASAVVHRCGLAVGRGGKRDGEHRHGNESGKRATSATMKAKPHSRTLMKPP